MVSTGCGDGTCQSGETCNNCPSDCACPVGQVCAALAGAVYSCCARECASKVCGPDGCGGTCGPGCPQGQTCNNGACTPATAGLKVQYRTLFDPSPESIHLSLKLVNTGAINVPLSSVKLRYWFTLDSTPDPGQQFYCDFASIGCFSVAGAIATVSPARPGANRYVEIGFASGSLQAGSSSEFQGRFNNNDFSAFDQSNDYSYGTTSSAFTDWPTVTAYVSGLLVWGSEP